MKLRLAVTLFGLVFWGVPAFGQGCAMCYSTAAAASKDGQHAINRAVMVLLLPPLTFMTVGIGMAVRYSKKRDQQLNRSQF
ncbi:MAG: hypothetical protein JO266_15875 [Acidobacteria bacterium]|nr:hypothetical protein [Acidobacteriota bacterium]MBV8893423.1 hypothetical protein [Acidobacteriota bacterium]MBV9479413.1 hypothetical protein [Acidobacteriota bacterium]